MSELSKNLLLLCTTALLCLITFETALRFIEADISATIPGPYGINIHQPNISTTRYDSESETVVPFVTNSEGFIDRDTPTEKSSTTLRIAIIGDSFVAGKQVAPEKRFVDLLESKLNTQLATAPSRYQTAEVLSFGIGGIGTVEAMLYYKHYVAKYHPDMVIHSVFVGNDIADNRPKQATGDQFLHGTVAEWEIIPTTNQSPSSLKKRLFDSSATVRLIYRVVKSTFLNDLLMYLGLTNPAVNKWDMPLGKYIAYENLPYYAETITKDEATDIEFTSALIKNFSNQVEAANITYIAAFIPEGLTLNEDLIDATKTSYPTFKASGFRSDTLMSRLTSPLLGHIKTINPYDHFALISAHGELYLHGHGHFNEAGHEAFAESLFTYLVNYEFLK